MTKQFLTLSEQTRLHVQMSVSSSPTWLVVTHGLGEHLGRHQHLVDLLGDHYNLLFYDLRGHGQSEGRRAYVERFSLYADDLRELLAMLRERHGMERFILFGHSMGGTITCDYLQRLAQGPLYPERVFLSSPAVGIGGLQGKIIKHLPVIPLRLASALPLSREFAEVLDLNDLSHRPEVAEEYRKDPLNCLQIHSKLLLELALATRSIFSRPLRLKAPAVCAYGTGDKICCPVATRGYFRRRERGVELQPFEGAYHEIHNESDEYRSEYFRFLKDTLQG